MANWGNGVKGAAGGAAAGASFGPWGAAIGGAAGGLLGLFGSGDSSASDADLARQQAYWDELAKQAPDQNADWRAQLADLATASKRGLDPQSKLALLESIGGANQLAQQREGAALQGEQMRGGGVANSGQSLVAQQQAAQGAAQRAQMEGGQIASANDARKIQAQQQFLNQMQQNQNFYQYLTAGRAGQAGNALDYHGAQQAAAASNMGGALSGAGALGMAYLNSKGGGQDPSGYSTATSLPNATLGNFSVGAAPSAPSGNSMLGPGYSPAAFSYGSPGGATQMAPSDALNAQDSAQNPQQRQQLTKTSGR